MGHSVEAAMKFFNIVLVILFAFSIKWASATSYELVPWQKQAIQADFIGLVECVKAGGIVAEFKIIDPWKGGIKNEYVMISMPVDSYGPQYPVALCGEQFVVMAHKNDLKAKLHISNDIPLWWRNLPFDYYLFHGEQWKVKDGNIRDYIDGEMDLNSFKQKVTDFLEVEPQEQELEVLRKHCETHLFNELPHDYEFANPDRTAKFLAAIGEWQKTVQGATTLEEMVTFLLNPPKSLCFYNKLPSRVVSTLMNAAHKNITDLLKNFKKQGDYPYPLSLDETIMGIESKVKSLEEWKRETRENVLLSDGTLVDLNAVDMASVEKSKKYFLEHSMLPERLIPEYAILCEYEPEFILEYLKKCASPDSSKDYLIADYVFASFFCRKVPGDRIKIITELLDVESPYKKVAAAVYLSFDDAPLGQSYLAKFSELEGDSGVWAALNMLRRGEQKYMPRALTVFNTPCGVTMATVNHDNLQKRLLVLISNSCSKSGLPMPELMIADINKPDVPKEEIYKHNMSWWESVKDKITIYDPWFKELAEQKVD